MFFRPEGLKFEKAKEWRIPVVNTQWLIDLILADLDALRLPVPNKYLQLNQAEPFKMDLSKVSHLMGKFHAVILFIKNLICLDHEIF